MGHSPLDAITILLAAQLAHATLTGIVRDAETAVPLSGAIVALPDLDRAAATDTSGRYAFPGVPAGPQHVTVRRIGYAVRSLHALVPRGGALEVHVTLRPEPVRIAPLEVQAPVSIRGAEPMGDAVFPDRASSAAAVRNHPLLAEPDVFQALGGGEVVLAAETPSGVHVQGGASDQTAYLLDGVPILNPYHAAGVTSAWNPDALSKVELSPVTDAPPHALSAAIQGHTRPPGSQLRVLGGASTTQARVTFGGPAGVAGAGYVVSLRTGLHDLVAPSDEASYVRGGTGDWLAKVEGPALGGQVRLLGYGNANELGAAAAADLDAGTPRRNAFVWHSRSFGADWRRDREASAVRVSGWGANGDVGSTWIRDDAAVEMTGTRRDYGFLASAERRARQGVTTAHMRLEHVRTTYRIASDSAAGPAWRLDGRTPVATAGLQHARSIGARTRLTLGASTAATSAELRPGFLAQVRVEATEALTLTARYARTHQFAQSLRNPESVVGTVFPVDAFVGAGSPGVPIASSHQALIAADLRPAPGVRLGLQAYARDIDGWVLVAPREGGPFATRGFTVGSGTSRGASADLAVGSARYAAVASYGVQRVRATHGDSSYVPAHGAAHLLEGGVIVFPTPTLSVRLGAAAAMGRRATAIHGDLEWESCNLLDQGCEFAGSPETGGEPLGGVRLPAYLRVDLGVRKHWHVALGGHDAQVAVFATITNLLGRRNVLTYTRDLETGRLQGIDMRPAAPLVVGLDGRF